MTGLPEVGARYGRYQLNRLIAQDGAGVVYEATDTMLRRPVALTVFLPGLDGERGLEMRIAREASELARIRSRNVVTTLDHGAIDGTVYRATELFPDGDLASWLQAHGPLASPDALALASQVCGALAEARAAGVPHTGPTAGGVLVRSGPEGLVPYVAGLVRVPDGPEPATDDQYAVGVLLWTCLTGAAPVAGVVPQIGGSSPGTAALNLVLQRTLSPDPDDRYASTGELLAALDRVRSRGAAGPARPVAPPAPVFVEPVSVEPVRGEPMLFRSQDLSAAAAPSEQPPVPAVAAPLPPAPAAELPSTPARRRRWWLAAIAAVVLLVGGVAVALARGGDDAEPQAATQSPDATITSASTSPSPSATPTPPTTPSSSPAVVVSSAPPRPEPAIGRLTRSSAACQGTSGDYQKWQYALTGFRHGRTLRPHLAIRSDHGDGEATGKPITIGPHGTATGDFCVPAGTHGTVTITVADTSARRPIG